MRALVTGGTGFLGQALSLRLMKLGFEVTAIGRNPQLFKPLEQHRIRVLQADLRDINAIIKACKNQDYVFHCGAMSSPWGRYKSFYESNVIGTQHVIQGCMRHSVSRLIHVSTPSLYFDFTDKRNISEKEALPKKLVNAYAKTKGLAENELDTAFQKGLSVIILRPRGLFGPGDRSLIPRLIKAHQLMPLPLFKSGKVLLDMTYIENVVDALILCMQAPTESLGRKFNITNDEPLFLIELLEKLFRKLKVELKVKAIPYPLAHGLVWMLEKVYQLCLPHKEPPLTCYTLGLLAKDQTLDITAAKTLLGYTPKISMEEGLDRFVAFFRK